VANHIKGAIFKVSYALNCIFSSTDARVIPAEHDHLDPHQNVI
jgi:hypothetical protein